MGTGIVSVALLADRELVLSRVLLAIAAAVWLGLALLLARRLVRERARLGAEVRSPAGLTLVAASAVLGTRLVGLGSRPVGWALLAVALVLWVLLLPPTLRSLPRRAPGSAFMVTVASEAPAVLAATLASRGGGRWLAYAAIAPLLLGLLLYLLALARFDLRELERGAGDQWVAGGALAISALAAGQVDRVLQVAGMRALALALWVAAALWLVPLLAAELRRPRLRYDRRRWSTVFPLGMYAACSFSVGSATGTPGLGDFARVWTWVAFAGWAAVCAGLLRRSLAAGQAHNQRQCG